MRPANLTVRMDSAGAHGLKDMLSQEYRWANGRFPGFDLLPGPYAVIEKGTVGGDLGAGGPWWWKLFDGQNRGLGHCCCKC